MWLVCGTREIWKILMERTSAKNYFMPTPRSLAKTNECVGGHGNDHAILNVKP